MRQTGHQVVPGTAERRSFGGELEERSPIGFRLTTVGCRGSVVSTSSGKIGYVVHMSERRTVDH